MVSSLGDTAMIATTQTTASRMPSATTPVEIPRAVSVSRGFPGPPTTEGETGPTHQYRMGNCEDEAQENPEAIAVLQLGLDTELDAVAHGNSGQRTRQSIVPSAAPTKRYVNT